MVRVVQGDLFASQAGIWVNTVNCVGVMGKGIALSFKQRYPEMFKEYAALCKKRQIRVGEVWIWHNPNPLPIYVVNFPTKDDWRNPSRLEWIVDGLANLKEYDIFRQMPSVAMPALGCNNGGLDFADVRKVIEDAFNDSPVDVALYEPQ